MKLSDCMAVVNDLGDADRDAVLARVDMYRASGMGADKAQRAAVQDMLSEIDHEQRGIDALGREQHADAYSLGELVKEPQSQFFGNDEPMLARRQGRFDLRRFGVGAQIVEGIQDRYNRWKHAIEDVRKQGGTVTEDNDFYAHEERYWGTVGAGIEDFRDDMQQLVKAVAADGLTLDDVALYAYAQHAQERNAYIASIRPGMADGGSGMSNADAQAFLDDARNAGLDTTLAGHADTLRQWIEQTRDILMMGGLITSQEHQAWSSMFQTYVPLRGLDGETQRSGTGQGFNIRGREGKSAMGRKSQARDIIEQVIQDRTRALIRVGKNEVLRSFAQFVLDNPSPNLWEINAVQNKPVQTIDANGNRVIDVKQVVDEGDNTVTVKDAGREVHIRVNDERLLTQLKNLHMEQVGRFVGALLWVNRQLSRLYTSLSPVFTVLNGLRDTQAATVGIIDEVGFMAVPRMYAKLPGALYDAWMAEAGKPSPDYQLYRATGGKTGFFDFKTVDAQADELRSMLDDANRSMLNPRKFGRKLFAFVEGLNGGIENATRLAAFKVARESGKSTAEAARISKNITVNFNRKGSLTPALSAWFLFFNPAVQGSARVLKSLKNPKVMATLGTGMMGIAALALRNAGMGDDDDGVAWWDKIPAEVKERNIIVVLPPGASSGEQVPGSKVGRYLKVPMPYGYNWFAVVANQAVDMWRHSQDKRRGRSVTDGATQALNAFMGAWVPAPELGTALTTDPKALALLATPDALNPLMQGVLNVNSFGRKMYPDDQQSQSLPDSARYFSSQAGTLWQRAAEGLNSMAGGSHYRPAPGPMSVLDITPAEMENLARGYGGGPVSFGIDLMNAIYMRQSIQRPTIEQHRLPFVKQLYGVIDSETDRMVSNERLEDVGDKVARIERAMREGNGAEVDSMLKEYGPIAGLGGMLKATRQQMSTLRKAELAVLSDEKSSEATRYARMLEINLQRRQVLQAFNRAYASVLAPEAPAAPK